MNKGMSWVILLFSRDKEAGGLSRSDTVWDTASSRLLSSRFRIPAMDALYERGESANTIRGVVSTKQKKASKKILFRRKDFQ
jgi:hypothetical protein